jgi:H+/Cl- antiporter ClcA
MELTDWLVLVLLTLVGIAALLFASGTPGGSGSFIGMLIAAAAVGAILYRVKQYFDRVDANRH